MTGADASAASSSAAGAVVSPTSTAWPFAQWRAWVSTALSSRRTLPIVGVLLAVYGVSRVYSTALLATFYSLSESGNWSIAFWDGPTGFAGFLRSWDGRYYGEIAESGYPATPPQDGAGNITKNPWAFLPLYPLMVRGVMAVTHLGFPVAGVAVSMIFGGAATVALYYLLRHQFGYAPAFWGAVFFCFNPLSFLLQVTYAESAFLFFMFSSLLLMRRRRFLLMIPFGVAAAFSHPGALALSAALGFGLLSRLARRERSSWREHTSAAVAIVVTTAAGFAWPVVAAAATGIPDAYFETEMAWWQDYIGRAAFVPFTPWFHMAQHFLGALGPLLVVAVLLVIVSCLVSGSRRWSTGTLAYTGSYLAYLVAVFLPQQSIFRMLLPLSPLLGEPALSRTPTRRAVTLGVMVVLQPVGILLLWVVWPP